MALTRAEIQRRWRERKRQGLVQPRAERARTRTEEMARLHRELNRKLTVELLDALAKRMKHPEDRGAVWDAIEEVKKWP